MGGCLKLMWYIKRSILGFHFMEALFNSSATKSGKNCPNAPQGREKTEKKPCPLSRLSSTFRMAATLFHSALLMPPLNEPTNLEK